MSTMYRYALPVEQTKWKFDGKTETCFTWEYDDSRAALLQLYDKGKKQQWDAAERIDWSLDLDPENPMMLDDRVIPIFGTEIWNRMTEKERREVRHHLQASQISQFMHGEQGALIATSKIVQTVPDLDSKFYAATQVMDEPRHVEVYSPLLHEKFELAYPITYGLSSLLEQGLSDRRWDMTYLTMQILIEGLALAAFRRIRDQSKNPLAAAVNAYVMQDEARHVAFGRIALRDYYPKLSDAERNEREEFVVDACWHMRERFSIVPTVRDIGLWGPRVQQAFMAMAAIEFATVDAAAHRLSGSRPNRGDQRKNSIFASRNHKKFAGAAEIGPLIAKTATSNLSPGATGLASTRR
jgi:P-aminobenzoate N-oxygenase AurF